MSQSRLPSVKVSAKHPDDLVAFAHLIVLDDAHTRLLITVQDFLLDRPHLPVQAMLWLAVEHNRPTVIPDLARHRLADLNERRQGRRAHGGEVSLLMLAVINGHTEVARALLAGGADPNLAMADDHRALDEVDSQTPPELFKLLLIHGADPYPLIDGIRVPIFERHDLPPAMRAILYHHHPDLAPEARIPA